MNEKKAFPVIEHRSGYNGENEGIDCADPGMDLRDYFAAKALAGMLANTSIPPTLVPSQYADDAYQYANAMMEARKKCSEK